MINSAILPFVQSLRVCVRVHAASLSGPGLINSEACSKLLSESDTTSTFTGTTKDWWPEKAPEKSYKRTPKHAPEKSTYIYICVCCPAPSIACLLRLYVAPPHAIRFPYAYIACPIFPINHIYRHGNDRSHARRPRVHGDESTDELDQHPCCLDLNQCLCEHTARRARTGPISICAAWTSICERAHIPIHDEHSSGQQQGSTPIGALARG